MIDSLKFCVLFLGMFPFFSCANQQPDVDLADVTQIDVGIEEGDDNFFDTLVDDVRFVPLETSDLILLGEIEKIVYHDSDYYVADKSSDGMISNIYRFDSEGRFLNKIGMRGRGPGEYASPADFIVNSSDVIVLGRRRLLFYDHDGTYKKEVPLEYIVREITPMPDENLIFAVAGDNRHRLEAKGYEALVLDTEGNLVSVHLPCEYQMNYHYNFKSFLYGDKVIYSRPFHKYVYSVDKNEAVGKYSIVLRDSPLPADYEKICRGDFERFMDRYMGKYNYFVGGFLENDDVVFFTTESKERQRFWNVYDKRTGEVHTGRISVTVDPSLFNVRSMIVLSLGRCLTTGDNGDIIGCINAVYLSSDTVGHRDEFPSLARVEEDDNPVIFHFKFKR